MILAALEEQAPDALLQLIKLHAADNRPNTIDVGVGVYRDEQGRTPVFAAVKAAEQSLLSEQTSKSYLGADGDARFVALLAPIVFGPALAYDPGLWGLQTPGGTGALRLGADLIARANPNATLWLWTPTWPNHPPIMRDARLRMETVPGYDAANARLDWDAIERALSGASAGDALLVQAGCHNPSGCDLKQEQWHRLGALCRARGILPFIDSAYQGLGDGIEDDAAGLRILVEAVDEAIIAYSCDKNFGLYRDRVGALWVKTKDERISAVRSNLFELARALWSMPPDHGAAIVRIVLEDDVLTQKWRGELDGMRLRINAVRQALADADPRLNFIAHQRGLFAMLPLTSDQVVLLREDFGVYMAPSGRINIAGLTMAQVPSFVAALRAVW
jgi:aromatic-amino-acid transaminase